MHRPQQQVDLFHKVCGLRRPGYPCVDWDDVRGLRFDLMEEELMEFKADAENEDLLGCIDALCDLLYVTYGAAVAMGIDLEPFFEEVQRANMEKTNGPKREDGKQLKPEGWQPPNHAEVYESLHGTSNYYCDTGVGTDRPRSIRPIRSTVDPDGQDESTEEG